MKVVVDLELCEGNAKCSAAAPKVFEVRDDDRSYLLVDPVPESERAAVERAARLCPRAAITIGE